MNTRPCVAVASEMADLEALGPILRSRFDVTYIPRRELLSEYVRVCHPDIIILDSSFFEDTGSSSNQNTKNFSGFPRNNLFAIIDNPKDRHDVYRAGCSGFLLKPFDRLDVIAQLSRQLSLQQAQAALQCESVRLGKVVDERLEELSTSRMQIIGSLGRAAEFKDNETGLHVVRMSKVSGEIALELGLDPETVDLLVQAAPMHDVGKIGIPDKVLLKPGKLDEAEWEIMKTHPALGASILGKGTTHLQCMARTVAVAHHEKWNGSGYPRGLSQEEIPLEARIVSVADIFDALTSKRPYKKAWPIQEAVEYITSQSDNELDGRVVEAFNQRISKIKNITESYAD
jgi:putative two-component system response regulator